MISSQATSMTVADYCAAMDRNDIIVDRTYQRSDKVWPDAARSFLMESIILGYPIPKIFLRSKTDLKTRRTIKEIVDGQQRSRAIHDFFHDRFKLSKTLETEDFRGLSYSELPAEWQDRFISYSISIDLFVSATADEVRQSFRRMNSYTVPLNPEELRHAEYQGILKWFLYELARSYEERLAGLGVFSQKQLVRMADLKLFTEIAHAIKSGVTTTNRRELDRMYRGFDQQFAEEADYARRIRFAFNKIVGMEFLKDTNIAKPYMIYSLAVTLINGLAPIPGFEKTNLTLLDDAAAVERNLLDLSDALDLEDGALEESPFKPFIEASSERTNVKAQREVRIRWLTRALGGPAP
jgi:hypothetical protein